MNRFSIQHLPLQPTVQTLKKSTAITQGNQSFVNHLHEVSSIKLKISKHANDRLLERKISITYQEL